MRNPAGWAALTAFSLMFFLFIYAPLMVIVSYSFNSNPIPAAIRFASWNNASIPAPFS